MITVCLGINPECRYICEDCMLCKACGSAVRRGKGAASSFVTLAGERSLLWAPLRSRPEHSFALRPTRQPGMLAAATDWVPLPPREAEWFPTPPSEGPGDRSRPTGGPDRVSPASWGARAVVGSAELPGQSSTGAQRSVCCLRRRRRPDAPDNESPTDRS